MSSAVATTGEGVHNALDTLVTACAELGSLSLDGLDAPEVLATLDALQQLRWALEAVDHKLVARMRELGPESFGGDKPAKVLMHRLRVPETEAYQRVRDAEKLGPRHALTGQELPPQWSNVAAGVADGQIGPAHVKHIGEFFKALPAHIDLELLVTAEEMAAEHARIHNPATLRVLLNRMLLWLDPDGCFNDTEIRRKRGLTIGKQGPDGLTPFHGFLDSEAAAVLEAVNAKLAGPGMCNPDDDTPCMTGRPTQEQITADTRTRRQRNHDALIAMGRIALSSKKLGKLNGLPVTVVVTTTLQELQSGAGFGHTGGGSLLPMRDLVRMASHAHHYLAVFDDDGQALWLGRSKRIASPAQRLMLFGKYRGCTAPGCTIGFYHCQAHHAVMDWGHGGQTNITDLSLACGTDNTKLNTPHGWTTRQRPDGTTEWIPPPHMDNGGARINHYHHPETLLDPTNWRGMQPNPARQQGDRAEPGGSAEQEAGQPAEGGATPSDPGSQRGDGSDPPNDTGEEPDDWP
jgi:hypothetical protein